MSSPFAIPQEPEPLSPTLQTIVDESAVRFERYLVERMGTWANVPQIRKNIQLWVGDYKQEVATVARQSFDEGKK